MTSDTLETPKPDPISQEIALRLSAVRAALDPGRRTLRLDLLVAAVVEVLGQHGPLPLHTLTELLRKNWQTESVSEELVTQAVSQARGAQLIVVEQRFENDDIYWLTEQAFT